MLIEIRDAKGTRLAASHTISGAIEQLAALANRYEDIVRAYQKRASEFLACAPDDSATADEHKIGFAAGWKAAQRRFEQDGP